MPEEWWYFACWKLQMKLIYSVSFMKLIVSCFFLSVVDPFFIFYHSYESILIFSFVHSFRLYNRYTVQGWSLALLALSLAWPNSNRARVRARCWCLGPALIRRDCQGFWNPCGLRVGYAGVGVRVGFFQPSPYPYPWCGFAGSLRVSYLGYMVL